MNWVDFAILGVVGGSTVLGVFWGLIRQVISIAGLVVGIYLAGRFYGQVAEFLHGPGGTGLVSDLNWARIIAFAALVIGVSLIAGIIGTVLRLLAGILFLGWLDHLLGGLLGFITSLTLVTVLLLGTTVFSVPGLSESIGESKVAQWVIGFSPLVLGLLPAEFNLFPRG